MSKSSLVEDETAGEEGVIERLGVQASSEKWISRDSLKFGEMATRHLGG